jgi:hypothetical protein
MVDLLMGYYYDPKSGFNYYDTITYSKPNRTYSIYLTRQNEPPYTHYLVTKVNRFVDYSEDYDYGRNDPEFSHHLWKALSELKQKKRKEIQELCPDDNLLSEALAKPPAPSNRLFYTVNTYEAYAEYWNMMMAKKRNESQQGDSSAPEHDSKEEKEEER